MKPKFSHLAGLLTFSLCLPVTADTIYSGLLDTTIPTDFTGITININGGTLNPFFGGVGVANNNLLQPLRDGTGNLDTLLNLSAGTVIDASSLYLSTGYGGSQDHVGDAFTAGQEGYIGFKLNGADYGWMRVIFTNNTGGAMVKDWAYDNGGGAIATGNVLQSGSIVTLDSAFGSFTLGSQITGSNGVVKNGANAVTLWQSNGYNGSTSVNQGTLSITGSGNINSTSAINVAAGATFAYNSSTALAVAPTLNGTGTATGQRAVLSGTGTINATITLDHVGDVLSPGNSPGTLGFGASQSWDAFSYDWELNNWDSSVAGTNYDRIGITGMLTLGGNASGSYLLNLLSLTGGNMTGDVPDFLESSRSWTILTTTGGISGFDPAYWNILTSGFTNNETGNWSLALANEGKDLVLSYAPVPEPRAALLGGLGLLLLMRRRRN